MNVFLEAINEQQLQLVTKWETRIKGLSLSGGKRKVDSLGCSSRPGATLDFGVVGSQCGWDETTVMTQILTPSTF